MKSILSFVQQRLGISENVPACFILKSTESTVRGIRPFRPVSVVVHFSVPCDQAHYDFGFRPAKWQ